MYETIEESMRPALVLLFFVSAWPAQPQAVRSRRPITNQAPVTACSATLPDGRAFLTGGSASGTPIATASFFRKDGQIIPAAPMLAQRASHVCIALSDGSLLVAGGSSGPGGPTSSAELFRPESNVWTTTGAMLTARTNAAAILLASGKVLVAGGQTSGQIANTLEIYDPAVGRFRLAAGILSSPRARHALAVLSDGRVLIAGGADSLHMLDTLDIFDPESETIRPAGFMTTPRSDFTATALADGRVLLVGGSDGTSTLDSAEIWDPVSGTSALVAHLATPRRNHIAIRPPGSTNVLIAGGSPKQAEIFLPATNQFAPAKEATPSDPITVTVGSLDESGKPSSVRVYVVP